MKNIIFILILTTITSNSFSEEIDKEVSLNDIIFSIKKIGIEDTLQKIEKSNEFDKTSRKIILADKVVIFATDRSEKIKWTLSNLNKGEFSLSITIGDYSFQSSISTLADAKTIDCDENGASSGTKIIYFEKTPLVVAESWSCGSRGCSYNVLFSKNITADIQYFCL